MECPAALLQPVRDSHAGSRRSHRSTGTTPGLLDSWADVAWAPRLLVTDVRAKLLGFTGLKADVSFHPDTGSLLQKEAKSRQEGAR